MEREKMEAHWIVKGKNILISFLGEGYSFNWEIVMELETGRVVGSDVGEREDAALISNAITNALINANDKPSEIILIHKSPTLFREVQGHLTLKGIQIPLLQPTPQHEVKGYIIDMFLEQFERKVKSLEIKGKTKLDVAREIMKAIVSLYTSMINDPPKKFIEQKTEEKKAANVYTPPPIKEHVLQAEVGRQLRVSASDHSKPRVLIADDSYSELQLVEMALKEAGYDTVTVMDGEAAEYKMRVEKFDAAVIDIIMPKKNGYQVCRDMRKDPAYKDIPIIMVSSKNQTSDKVWGLKQGANEYLVKPFNPNDLIKAIKKYVKLPA
ncbi:MAG: response regulator [Nitrospirota bacterium]